MSGGRMRLLGTATPEPVPAGKRTVRATVYGNVNAYVSGRFWKTLGVQYAAETDEAVEQWLSGADA